MKRAAAHSRAGGGHGHPIAAELHIRLLVSPQHGRPSVKEPCADLTVHASSARLTFVPPAFVPLSTTLRPLPSRNWVCRGSTRRSGVKKMQALRAPLRAAAYASAVAHPPRGARCAPASCAARVVLRGSGAEQLSLAKHGAAPQGLCRQRRHQRGAALKACCAANCATLKALLWDCDGVILESEDLHRRAYNAVFKHYNVLVDGKVRAACSSTRLVLAPHARTQVVYWSEEYYDMLSNTVGGGKPKMRWCVCPCVHCSQCWRPYRRRTVAPCCLCNRTRWS